MDARYRDQGTEFGFCQTLSSRGIGGPRTFDKLIQVVYQQEKQKQVLDVVTSCQEVPQRGGKSNDHGETKAESG